MLYLEHPKRKLVSMSDYTTCALMNFSAFRITKSGFKAQILV